MKNNGRRSLLSRVCGMYSVQSSDDVTEHGRKGFFPKLLQKNNEEHMFIVFNNVFPAEGSNFISQRFDLKGSTVGRECTKEERSKKGKSAVLKDLNLIEEAKFMRASPLSPNLLDSGINIGERKKSSLLSQLRRDVELLVDCGVMDYSLLIGIVNMEMNDIDSNCKIVVASSNEVERVNRKSRKCLQYLSKLGNPLHLLLAPPEYLGRKIHALTLRAVSTLVTCPLPYYGSGINIVDGGEHSVIHGKRFGQRSIYYLGVIDFLQPWTMKKVIEREIKGILGYDTKAISCVNPREYASRFLNFINIHVT